MQHVLERCFCRLSFSQCGKPFFRYDYTEMAGFRVGKKKGGGGLGGRGEKGWGGEEGKA